MSAAAGNVVGMLSSVVGLNDNGKKNLTVHEIITSGLAQIVSLVAGYKIVHKFTDSEFLSVVGAIIAARSVGQIVDSTVQEVPQVQAKVLPTEQKAEVGQRSPQPPLAVTAKATTQQVVVNESQAKTAD